MGAVVISDLQPKSANTYRRLWLFSACAYKLRLQETMRLTDNVRLTSGIIVATPGMRKHVIAKRVIDRSDRSIVNVKQVQKLSHVHAKHGYTPIQYTLWAEMIGASTNNSEDESPILFQCSLAKQKTKEDR